MKKSSLIVILLILSQTVRGQFQTPRSSKPFLNKSQVGAKAMPEEIAPIIAPFDMPQLQKPKFSAYTINITSMGASPKKKATKHIQNAIDKVSKRGGGTVIVPAGIWKTSRIHLKSNVNLHLQEGAELHVGGEIEDFLPAVFTRVEGIEVMSSGGFIYAHKAENIALTGKGKIVGPELNAPVRTAKNAPGVVENAIDQNSPVKDRIHDGHKGRFFYKPKSICLVECKNVLIEGITIERSVTWNVTPIYCDGVIIRGITVNSVGIPTGDGIDIESSRNVLIEYATLNNGDDCFTMKSGRDKDGIRVDRPTENIVVRYCLSEAGHGAITTGSETAGWIRNIYLHDCIFDGTDRGFRFKTRRPRGGGVENIFYERVEMNIRRNALEWDLLGSRTYVGKLADRLPKLPINELTPVYRNIFFRDVKINTLEKFIVAKCIPEIPLTNVVMENMDVTSGELILMRDVKDFVIRNSTIRTKDQNMEIIEGQNVLFDNVNILYQE
ncbi:glycoside hydrolase family 28 protein [Aurantibacter crassamenti]|uniref:glycoside hydrolase family 28 protein n=1 Tax=Aurantibacter crassamenti TaxID=1837375 RepID=UPI001939368E|nr:glycoside hydrolase family 28 protein [Aurantibacter crassamenti]MBM1104547.1 glycoside hydrolase family 28 protein [Aurantibacter crassamenti]